VSRTAPANAPNLPAAQDPVAQARANLPDAVDELAASLDSLVPVDVVPAPPTEEEVAAARAQEARREAAAMAEQMRVWASSTDGYANGHIPTGVLCARRSAPTHLLRCDAAHMFDLLDAGYRDRFGADLGLTDSYRSYSAQVSTRAAKGSLAAPPGMSQHGRGLAVDVTAPASRHGSAQNRWLVENAPDYGWVNPDWARGGYEPWHFEFVGAPETG
jgi:hypothetical protein